MINYIQNLLSSETALEKRVVWWMSGVLLVACILRIYALVGLPVRRITDDSWEYYSIARNIPAALKGEPIENRQEYLSFAANRGWLYPLFIAGVFKAFSPKVRYVLAIQALLSVVTCLLLFLIGREIFSPPTGVLAALLGAIYPGFIFHTPVLYQETTSLFILALMVYMLCLADSQKRHIWFCGAGALIALLSLYRSGFILFLLAGTPLFMFVQWRLYQRSFVRYFASFLLGIVLVCALYGVLAYRLGGSIFLEKPTYVWNFYEPIHNDGWLSDIFAPTYSEELEAVAQQHNYPLPAIGKALEYPSEFYLKAAIRFIRTKPLEYSSQLVKRTARMWFYFESYPGRWHSPLLLGLGLSLPNWSKTWIFYLTIFYVTIISIPFIGLPRYAMPAMPFIIILASYVNCQIYGALKDKKTRRLTMCLLTFIALFAAAGTFLFYMSTACLLKLFRNQDPGTSYTVTIVLMNTLFIILAGFFCRLLKLISPPPKKVLLIVAFPLLLVLILYNNSALVRRTGPAWWTSLTKGNTIVRQSIELPDNFNTDDYLRAKVMIDLFPEKDSELNFSIFVNGKQIKTFKGGLKAETKKFNKKLGGLYKRFLFDGYGLKPENLRQWYAFDLPLSLLQNISKVEITCSTSSQTSGTTGRIMVFGDHIKFGTTHLFQGPCFPRYDTDTSMYKVMPYCGDYRFEGDTLLSSRKTISEYYSNGEWQRSDLSDKPGRQTGAYRIRIELIDKYGNQSIS